MTEKTFEVPDDMNYSFGNDRQPEETKTEPKMITMSQEQFDKLMENQNKDRQQQNEIWEKILNGGTQTQTQVVAPKKVELDLNGLPDPRVDWEGYNKGLAERLQATYGQMEESASEKIVGRFTEQQTRQQVMNDAWGMLSRDYPDLAEFPEIVEAAAGKAYAAMAQRGVDPITYMQRDMKAVVDQVASNANATITKIRGIQDEETEEKPQRTRVLQGNGQRRIQVPKEEKDNPNDLVTQLRKEQAQYRIY